MKNKIKKYLLAVTFCLAGLSYATYAQSVYKIYESKDIDMKLSGTSTLHKWTMDARTFTGEAEFDFKAGSKNQLTNVKSLTFSLAVRDLKSDEKGLDNNAYKALKTDQYKDIVYKLTSANLLPSEKDSKHLIKTHGNLTIAGVTKDVEMDVYCVVNNDATITCTGSDKLKMTDYQVKPPSFMLGAMKTGDDITLDFTLTYKK